MNTLKSKLPGVCQVILFSLKNLNEIISGIQKLSLNKAKICRGSL